MNYIDHRVIKTAFGAFISIVIANYLGLKYGITTGLVTIISIQPTKKESFKVASERFLASFIGLFISSIIFYYVGYNPVALGIFILIFMPLCLKFNLFQGFLVTVVLATHILSEKSVALRFLLNEFGILFLGATVAIVLNLYMPSIELKIKKVQDSIDELIKAILNNMAENLKCNCVSIKEERLFKELKNKVEEGRTLAATEYNNALIGNSKYNLDLFSMKRAQYKLLQRMRVHFKRFYITYDQSLLIAQFTKRISETIGKEESVKELILELLNLKMQFKELDLPKTREEFENRATLFQFLNDLEEFLEIKAEFLNKYNLGR